MASCGFLFITILSYLKFHPSIHALGVDVIIAIVYKVCALGCNPKSEILMWMRANDYLE